MASRFQSQVSRLCGEIDKRVNAFAGQTVKGDCHYLWLDATCVQVREAGPMVLVAVKFSVVVNTGGRCDVLGWDID